jgi:DNA-binding NarL/FixJ family response regulator
MINNRMRLIHIDDHVLFVQGVYSLLETEPNINWVGSAATFREGLEMVEEHMPDLVLLDYFLPDGTGDEAARKILTTKPNTPIIMLTMENNSSVMEKCKESGVMAFLPKSIDKDQLLKAIWAAASGEKTFPVLEKQLIQSDSYMTKLDILSKREKEVAYWISKGLSSLQVSEKLFLSQLTVKTHRRNLLKKLGFNNTAQLTALVSKYSRTELGLGD